MPRDQNSALVVLIDAHAVQQIPLRDTPGTGVVGETETAGAATRQVKVIDPRNPHYTAGRRLVAGEFMSR